MRGLPVQENTEAWEALRARLEEIRGESVTVQTAQTAEFESLRDTTTARLDDSLREFIERGDAQGGLIATTSTEAEEAREERLDELTAGYDQRFEELSETLRSASEALLAEQKAHLEATKKVRDAVARTGQAEAYGQDARNEESAYTKWRNVTIAFGVAAVTFLVALPILAEVFGWSGQLLETSVTSTVGRLAIAAAFGGLATWSV